MAENPYRDQPENAGYALAWDLGHTYGVAHPDEENPAPPHSYPPLVLDDQQTAWMDQVWQEAALAGRGDAAAATPASTSTGVAAGGGLSSTGAHATEEPASYATGGLPSFHYKLPDIPVAEAHIETPDASIEIELSVVGEVNVTFHDAVKSVQAGNEGMRVSAGHALGPLSDGIAVDHLGTEAPSVVLSTGTRFTTLEQEWSPSAPNTMKFKGTAQIQYTVDTESCGEVEVEGAPGWELAVTCLPHPQAQAEPATEVVSQESWVSQHGSTIAAAGITALILIGIGIALAPETGGGSLILVAAAAG